MGAAVPIDRAHGLVGRFAVTSAAAHESARLAEVLDKSNPASGLGGYGLSVAGK
jgi:hypothetical protein